ncbi:hypothetical protein O3P69_019852 [Scylla paramamosain]|uniref:Chaperone DnaJ C-terminal domain-containing protein n=1 Tax=Scylla paramamosain TaxID=85552 RepID=A0AAW0SBH3_SCYPA
MSRVEGVSRAPKQRLASTVGTTGMETITTGPFVMRQTCRFCHGTRAHIKFPCAHCEGKGQCVQRRTVSIPIPAGVEDGQVLRLSVGRKEVFVRVRVTRSDYFRRDGQDVHTDATIGLSQALLGGATRIMGVYEDLTLEIPAGTSSHTTIKLTGKGLKKVSSYGYGDHYVHVKIKIPTELTPKQKSLIIALAELEMNTPGTVTGMTHTKQGNVVSIESNKILESIRTILKEGRGRGGGGGGGEGGGGGGKEAVMEEEEEEERNKERN